MSETVFYNSKNLVGVGNVGIGTTNPVSRLAILCDDNWQGGITLGSAATGAAGFDEMMIQRGLSATAGGITNTTNVMVFHSVNENSATTGPVGFLWMSSGSRVGMFYDTRNSRLGIGTTNPVVALDVYTGTANAASVVASTAYNTSGTGVYQVAGTTVIDASRNLTNIGTVSSGAITSSSTISGTTLTASTAHNTSGTGVYQVASTTVIDASRNLTNIGTISSGAGTLTATPAAAANVLTVRGSSTAGNVVQFSNTAGGTFVMTNAGRIGINTTTPGVPLDVAGGLTIAQTASSYFTAASGTAITTAYTGSTSISIRGANYLQATVGFIAFSDARIKNIQSNVSNAVDIIQNLGVKKYSYIDYISNPNVRYGLIAQNVKEFIPEAVKYSVNTIPCVFKIAEAVSSNVITLSNHGLIVGDEVRLVKKDNTPITCIVSETSDNTFTINSSLDEESVFVYGKKVDDFLSIDYDQVHCVSIAAIQELSAKNTELESKLETAQNDIDLLESRLTAIEALIATNTSADTGSAPNGTRADALLSQV